MMAALLVLLRSVALICSGHRAVALENLALRQQLAVFKRTVQRPSLRPRDRLFWVLLAHAWRNWRSALIVVHPRRGRLASTMAPPPLDAPLDARSSWPAQYHDGHSDARRPDGYGEPAVGRASDSWGIE